VPNIIATESSSSGITYGDLSYTYPRGLDFRPSSPLHIEILSKLNLRAQESSREISKRHKSWKKIDRTLTAYIPADEAEQKVKDNDDRKPISIVIPYSFATLETLLTYLVAAFLDYPIFKYEGSSPEDRFGAILLEKVIEVQSRRAKMALSLHTTFRDAWAYDMGISAPYWDKVYGKKTRMVDSGFLSAIFGSWIATGQKKQSQDATLYEGNMLKNIDPYMFLPDPNVPIQDVQKGEFVGWIETTNYMKILEQEQKDPTYFNGRYLQGTQGSNAQSAWNKAKSGSGREDHFNFGSGTGQAPNTTSPVDQIYMYVNLIPKEWKLGTGEYPEKWLFCVAADKYIRCAKPLGLDHNMFPVVTCSPDFDGYSVTPISRLEVISGLQGTLDWLINCYDDQTEVLTERGWVGLSQTVEDDKVATVDPITKEFWFEKPVQWFQYDYEGPMVNFKSSRMDICVTPNHNMFVERRYERVGTYDSWQFKPAAFLGDTDYKTIGNVRWSKGVEPDTVFFEGKEPLRDRGCQQKYKDAEINPMVLAGFLGWFLSEGSISGGNCTSVKQSKQENYKDIDSLFEAIPFHVTVYQDTDKHATQWSITDKRLYNWLKENCYEGGTTGEFKKVPDFVRGWDDFHLNLLFERAMWGDGYWMPGHENLGNYGSKSKQLVDGMQEIALRLGYFSHIRETRTPLGDPFYMLQISTASTFPYITYRNCFKSDYKGKVYCFENSTHLTITRRNGKVAVQGQSHIANVRKSINDMLVVDPSLININDLLDPGPGKLIRMRRAAWGRGVENAVKQLAVTDITRNHIQDSAYITELIKTCSGSVDSVMGLARSGSERVSAAEAQGTRMSALSRLAKAAKVVSLQTMQDLGYMLASHTQQLMSQSLYVSMTGRWEDDLRAEFGDVTRKMVNPFDIVIDYDVVENDGSIPGDGDTNTLVQLFQTISSNPLLSNQFDMVRIFQRIARMSGVKDLSDFKAQQKQLPSVTGNVVPDATVQAEADKGNLIPIGGQNG